MQVNIKDGRVLIGNFHCLDKQGNLILVNTCEEVKANGFPFERCLGMVMIPPDMQTGCFTEVCLALHEEKLYVHHCPQIILFNLNK